MCYCAGSCTDGAARRSGACPGVLLSWCNRMQNYMADDPVCRAAVMDYAEAALVAKVGQGLRVAKSKTAGADNFFGGSTRCAPPPANTAASSSSAQTAAQPSMSASQAPPPEPVAPLPPPAPPRVRTPPATATVQPGPKAGAMTVKTATKAARGKGGRNGEAERRPARAALNALERKIFNCLSCGKVCTASVGVYNTSVRANGNMIVQELDFRQLVFTPCHLCCMILKGPAGRPACTALGQHSAP
jgi:hypothetical protein